MTHRLDQLNVFLEAIRHETQAIEALGQQLERSAAFDEAYRKTMDAYAQLRSLRASITETLDAPPVVPRPGRTVLNGRTE